VPIVAGSAGISLDAAWTPDIWGALRSAVGSAQAQAQASAADLAAARLSAIGLLATSYFSLRETDAELLLLDDTIEGYGRSYTIARNRYEAGIAPQSDVLQAQTQLVNARAERVALKRTRDTLEHAIAVLVGAAPADFQIAALTAWTPVVPAVPLGVPSTLLQRRPDIASAERAVAAANAQIGIQRAAYYPSLTISGSAGTTSLRWQDLFSAPQLLWSFGLSASQVLFDAGAIGARVDAAKAAHEASVARYRQTVLTAFQNVEDQLTATASLAQQEALRREASVAADKTEQQFLNRYRAGQVSYTDVVTAQASALSARRTVLQLQVSRQAAAVGLVQGLGGGWGADWLQDTATEKSSDKAAVSAR
jgi:NodT family efflux transporter outer membrane factor (OMF) lipoprotein